MLRTATIVFEAMATYRELLKQVKDRIVEVDAREARELDGAVWIDVREQDEWDEGHIPGAVHVPRGNLESRIEGVVPDRTKPVVIYCASGARSAFAADSLPALGYEQPVSLAGGFTDWKRNGYEIVLPQKLSPERRARYSRHLLIPEIGEEGQLKLLDSKILLIGAGGLGSPASLYLAAAGVGHLGIIDADIVDESNLQRQIAHSLNTLGTPKVDSAKRAIEALNPDVEVTTYRERLTSENIDRILDDGWDIIVDGADNFPTRYLVNDASVWREHPGRARLDLPLRGPGHGVQARRRAVLPLPLPLAAAARARAVVLRGRRARRAARHRRDAADERGAQARRRDRRPADRPAAAVRRARDRLHRGAHQAQPGLPGLRRAPDDHRVHRLRRVLHAMSVVRVPPSSARRRAARARSRPRARPCASCSRT